MKCGRNPRNHRVDEQTGGQDKSSPGQTKIGDEDQSKGYLE